VNGFYPGDLGRKRFASALAAAMSSHLNGWLIRLRAARREEDLLGLVEQQKLPPVFRAELLGPTPEDPPTQELDLLEMLQGEPSPNPWTRG